MNGVQIAWVGICVVVAVFLCSLDISVEQHKQAKQQQKQFEAIMSALSDMRSTTTRVIEIPKGTATVTVWTAGTGGSGGSFSLLGGGGGGAGPVETVPGRGGNHAGVKPAK